MNLLLLLLFALFAPSTQKCSPTMLLTISNFSATVFRELSRERTGKENFVITPLQAERFLATIYAGTFGETAVSVLKAAHIWFNKNLIRNQIQECEDDVIKSENKELKVGYTTVVYWTSSLKVLPSYEQSIWSYRHRANFKANFTNTTDLINGMNNYMQTLMPPINRTARVNVTYYEIFSRTKQAMISYAWISDLWKTPFSSKATYKGVFHRPTVSDHSVDFMRLVSNFSYYDSCVLDAQIIELPLKNEVAVFGIMLPKDKDGIYRMDVKSNLWMPVKTKLEYVDLRLPKFIIEAQIKFDAIVNRIGGDMVYVEWSNYTLMGKTKEAELYPRPILMKSFIQINESGINRNSDVDWPYKFNTDDPIPILFNADHPFIFYVRVNGVLLFIGRVDNPKREIAN